LDSIKKVGLYPAKGLFLHFLGVEKIILFLKYYSGRGKRGLPPFFRRKKDTPPSGEVSVVYILLINRNLDVDKRGKGRRRGEGEARGEDYSVSSLGSTVTEEDKKGSPSHHKGGWEEVSSSTH